MDFSKKIKDIAKTYFKDIDENDFSHGFTHVKRVNRLVKHIGEKEGADLEILDAAALLHDIGRLMEDRGKIEDHAKKSAELAKHILKEINFPTEKIDQVCYAIKVHRWRNHKNPETLEAKILQDADRLDALGAVDVARVIASKLQSDQYGGPIYVEEEYQGPQDVDKSAIHYLIHKTKQPKRKPKNFNTKTGKEMAKERFKFMEEYIETFKKEWQGEI